MAGTLAEPGLGDHRGGHGGRLDLSAAAAVLDMGGEELRTALRTEGTTLADVAEEQGVAVDALVDALVQGSWPSCTASCSGWRGRA